MNIKLKTIKRENLKAGDTIGIPVSVTDGWITLSELVHIVKSKIKIIYPENIIVTDTFGVLDKDTDIYQYDDNAKRVNELAEKYEKMLDAIYEIFDLEEILPEDEDIEDEDIIEISDCVEKIMEILDRYRKE